MPPNRIRAGAPDTTKMGQAFAAPGMDPRVWLTSATVDDGSADEPPVQFEDGVPFVDVTTQPHNIPLRCRVLMQSAGKGEGEWTPFVAGDEVLVAIPHGNAWAGAVILGRLNNSLDKLPMQSVAGQDPTKNNFAFKRTRTAWIHEVAGGWLVREATSGSFINVSKDGVITLRDGQKAALQMSADVFGYQSGDGKNLMQLDLDGRFTAKADDAVLTLSSSNVSPQKSGAMVPGSFAVSASGQPAVEHVVTTEALINIVIHVLQQIGIANPGPLLGVTLSAPFVSAAVVAGLAQAAVTPLPQPASLGIQAGFALTQQKPSGVPGLGQVSPGIGCVGFLAG